MFILSGKWKLGKDYVVNKLIEVFGFDCCVIVRFFGFLKYEYVWLNGFEFDCLFDLINYKEFYC